MRYTAGKIIWRGVVMKSFKIVSRGVSALIIAAAVCSFATPAFCDAWYFRQVPPGESDAVKSVNMFAVDMYKHLAAAEDGDFVFSPLNLSMTFGMVHLGMSDNGRKTLDEVFHYGGGVHENMSALMRRLNLDPGVQELRDSFQQRVANAFWPGVNMAEERENKNYEEYVESAKKYYDARVTPLDFNGKSNEAADVINAWIDQQTNGVIKNIFDGIGLLGKEAVVTGTAYFNAKWREPFNKGLTTPERFYTDVTSFDVDMMKRKWTSGYFETEDFQAVRIEYGFMGEAYMLVILPRKTDGLGDLDKKLSAALLDDIVNGTRKSKHIELNIPRFSTAYTSRNVLGMISSMSEHGDTLAIAEFLGKPRELSSAHFAKIKVDESGTEAAAVTTVVMLSSAAGVEIPQYIPFIADHPFLYAIIERRGDDVVMFMGRYTGKASKK
jgi:serpin B